MRHFSIYRQPAAIVLLFLIGSATTGQALHLLWAHQHKNHPHCLRKNGALHIHTPEYGHSACSLCDFTLSASELPALTALQLPEQPMPAAPRSYTYDAPVPNSAYYWPALRGPPAC